MEAAGSKRVGMVKDRKLNFNKSRLMKKPLSQFKNQG